MAFVSRLSFDMRMRRMELTIWWKVLCYLRGREASRSNANVCWHTMANKRDANCIPKWGNIAEIFLPSTFIIHANRKWSIIAFAIWDLYSESWYNLPDYSAYPGFRLQCCLSSTIYYAPTVFTLSGYRVQLQIIRIWYRMPCCSSLSSIIFNLASPFASCSISITSSSAYTLVTSYSFRCVFVYRFREWSTHANHPIEFSN